MKIRIAWLGAFSFAFAAPAILHAQDPQVLQQLYGRGVHAYFSGNYTTAFDELTRVIDQGSRDPRPYYFRAMTQLQLGRAEDAQSDMARGAELESLDVDGYYPVSRSLERVQGQGRLAIERHRAQARLIHLKRQESRDRQRYEAIKQREEDALRRQIEIPLDELSKPGVDPAKPADPFTEPMDKGELPAPPMDDEDPGDDDPFGDAEPMEESMEEPMEEPMEEAADDGDEGDDPFGGDAPSDPMDDGDEPDKPIEEPDLGDDPFGDSAEAPMNPRAIDEKPPAQAANPGGGDSPDPVGKVKIGVLGRILARTLGQAMPEGEKLDGSGPAGGGDIPFGLPLPGPKPGNDPFGPGDDEIPDEMPDLAPPDDDPFGAPGEAPGDAPIDNEGDDPFADDPN